MKIPTFFLTVLCVFWNLVLAAQGLQINADKTQGCDSLTVNFSFQNGPPTIAKTVWNYGDGTTSTSNIPKVYRMPGNYTVTLTINDTISVTNSSFIKVGRTPNRDSLNMSFIHRDTSNSILGPYSYVIEVAYNNNHPFPYTYQWYIDGVPTDINRSFPYTFDTVGLYHINLKMTDLMGCTATFSDSINVSAGIQVPNIFTPNDDTFNDELTIKYNGQDVISFKVYTRTGLLIYKAEATTVVWDGRLPSGDKVLSGIYFYVVETIKAATPVKKSGFVYIFR